MKKEDLRHNYEKMLDDALKTKSIIESAKKEGQTALELTDEAAQKLRRAENLAVAEGAIGQMISSASLKKATKAAKNAEDAVGRFNEQLKLLGDFDEIIMSADAESRLDNVLFTSADWSVVANTNAVAQRARDAVIAIKAALEKLAVMAEETEKTIYMIKEN